MNKLLLISANRCENPFPVYPIALSYLSGYIASRFQGIEVRIFDCLCESEESLLLLLREFAPDLIGISIRNIDNVNMVSRETFVSDCQSLMPIIRQNSAAPVVLGGAGYSIFPEQMLSLLQADFGIIGEGEESLCRLVECLASQGDFSDIEGLVYQRDGQILVNERKRDLERFTPLFSDPLLDYYWQHSGIMNIQTKRGCPFACIYCTYPLIDGHRVRPLDSDGIVEAISRLNREKGIDYFFFTDSVFNLNREFNLELAEEIVRRDLKIRWGAYFSPHGLDAEELSLYQRSGLTHIEFGTESLSDAVLEKYGKRFRTGEIIRSSELCHALKIHHAHFLILGGVGETPQSLLESLSNSERIRKSVFFAYIGMRIYPRTRLYSLAVAEGVIDASQPLLNPEYYISQGCDWTAFQQKTRASVNRWVFPDEDLSAPIAMMRRRGHTGPLWEYLIKP